MACIHPAPSELVPLSSSVWPVQGTDVEGRAARDGAATGEPWAGIGTAPLAAALAVSSGS